MHAHTATIEGVKTLVYQTNNNKTLLARQTSSSLWNEVLVYFRPNKQNTLFLICTFLGDTATSKFIMQVTPTALTTPLLPHTCSIPFQYFSYRSTTLSQFPI